MALGSLIDAGVTICNSAWRAQVRIGLSGGALSRDGFSTGGLVTTARIVWCERAICWKLGKANGPVPMSTSFNGRSVMSTSVGY